MKTKRKLCAVVSNIVFCSSLIRLPMQASAADDTYETVLMYYAVEDNCLAYKVQDPVRNHIFIGDGVGAVLYDVRANVFVDAKTGGILENRYDTLISVT